MNKVLFVTYFFPPLGGAGVHRSLKFAKYIAERGFAPVVIAAGDDARYQRDVSLLDEIPGGVEVLRIREDPGGLSRRVRNKLASRGLHADFPDPFRGWIAPAVRAAARIASEHDLSVVYSSSPPHSCHFVARAVREKFGIPWIADWRDPWSGNTIAAAYNRRALRGPIRAYFDRRTRAEEARLAHRADLNVVTCSSHKHQLCSDFGIDSRAVRIITNGYDERDFEGVEPIRLYPEVLTITYTGSFYYGYPEILQTFVGCLDELHVPAEVVVVGGGAGQLAELRSKRVTRILSVPKEKALRFAMGSDFLLLILSHGFRGIPGKLYDYLRTGRPILAVVPEESDAAAIVRSARAGAVIPEEPGKMRAAIADLFQGGSPWRRGCGGTDMVYVAQFERRRLAAELAEALSDVTGGDGVAAEEGAKS